MTIASAYDSTIRAVSSMVSPLAHEDVSIAFLLQHRPAETGHGRFEANLVGVLGSKKRVARIFPLRRFSHPLRR